MFRTFTLVAALASALILAGVSPAIAEHEKGRARTIVLGFDGMDPRLAEQWMAEGKLPNFAKLRDQGHYQRLPTTNPAQSPVAWATFATGLDPGAHGIFDFLHRDIETYGPKYSIASVEQPKHVLSAFGWRLPLDAGTTRTERSGTAFWTTAERQGHHATVIRVPATYPPDPITHMLSGMGVPDLLGTQDTFTIYTAKAGATRSTDENTGARIVPVTVKDGRIETTFDGPQHPLHASAGPLEVPLTVADKGAGRVRVDLAGSGFELEEGEWSDWVTLKFRFLGFASIPGIVRLYLVRGFPDLQLYVSPIQIDPRDPAAPITSPHDYASELAERTGLYYTAGMAEETWSLNEEQIPDSAYLAMVKTVLAEREAFLFDTLARDDSDLVVEVFVQTDRVSHMFWRGIDAAHPMHPTVDAQGKGAIRWIYGEADRILGRTMAALRPGDRLIVLSDHGFSSFRRGVNLNRWLVENGYMTLKAGEPASNSLFSNVDWTRTKAYAIGLNALYINRFGRESLGIVRDSDVAALKEEIRQRLMELHDPANGATAIAGVADADTLYTHSRHTAVPDLVVGYAAGYRASWATAVGGVPLALIEDNAKKWSGDHLIEPSLVPGVLFTSFPLSKDVASIRDVPALVETSLGLDKMAPLENVSPNRGWLEFASPGLAAVDWALSKFLPVTIRIVLWGILASFLSMLIYKWTSHRKRLAELKAQALQVRQRMDAFEGNLNELAPILREMLSVALSRLEFGLLPAVIASLPVLLILGWMSNAFDVQPPAAGAQIPVQAVPDDTHQVPPMHWEGGEAKQGDRPGNWVVTWPDAGRGMRLIDSDGTSLLTLPTAAAVSTVHQWRWWNSFIGNPAGYLPSPGDVDAIVLGIPRVEVMHWGPFWLRGWLALFIVVTLVASLGLKRLWRLHQSKRQE